MTDHPPRSHDDAGAAARTDLFFMVIAALLFGYYGFATGMTTTNASGQVVPMWALLLWTLRIGAVGFGLSIVLTFLAPLAGGVLYAVVGLLTSISLIVVGVMDILDDQYAAAVSPFFAFLFAAFNGWGSIVTLRGVWPLVRARMNRSNRDTFGLPPDA